MTALARCILFLVGSLVAACSSPSVTPIDLPERGARSDGETDDPGTSTGPQAIADAGASTGPSTVTDAGHRPTPNQDASTADAGPCVTNCASQLKVRAFIDGRSELLLSSAGVRWRHVEDAAPGLWKGANHPTLLNDTEWKPVWPKPGENRDCRCMSDTIQLKSPLAAKVQEISVERLVGRGDITIEQPTAENDFTAKVIFDDSAREASWYEVLIRYEK